MSKLAHKEKILAAIANPKCKNDVELLQEVYKEYENWIAQLSQIKVTGKAKVIEMTRLLNQYKDKLEVELIAKHTSGRTRGGRGQLHAKQAGACSDTIGVHGKSCARETWRGGEKK